MMIRSHLIYALGFLTLVKIKSLYYNSSKGEGNIKRKRWELRERGV